MDSTLEVLFILCIIISFYYLTQFFRSRSHQLEEGFTQNDLFVSKQDEHIYDDFYVSMYDRIHKTRQQSKYDFTKIVQNTQPSVSSVFLDIGSGTGTLVNRLNNNGFRAYGIDSSEAMVQFSTSKYPDSEFKCGDVKKSMEFEPETFSHVLCTYFTLYEMGDKSIFFDNCRRWLKTGGYLIVHLVDKLEFDTIVPVGKLFKNRHIDENTNTNNGTRILSTSVALPNIQYSHKYAFHDHDVVNRIETFTDKKTHKVRHQEGRTIITPISDIIQMAKSKGFYVKGYADYFPYNRDKHQYLYFFEKIDV